MMLFDSSAIINLCGERKLDRLMGGCTLDLAAYEVGNAVWKQVHIYRTINMNEGSLVLDSLTEVIEMLEKVRAEKALEVLKMAVEEDLTYYDASYAQAAIENGFTLVTDDEKLYEAGKKYVQTMKSDELRTNNLVSPGNA